MATFSLQVVAAIRVYPVYKESWEPSVGDLITFKRHIGELNRCIRCLYQEGCQEDEANARRTGIASSIANGLQTKTKNKEVMSIE